MRLKFLWVIVVSVWVCVPAFCTDAAMFRGNPQHSGIYEAAGVARFSQVKWKFHTDGHVISSPAVSGEVVFVGSTDGNLYAVNRESGALKWRFDAKSRITPSPAVSEGLVYFGAYDGKFYALGAAYAGKHLHGSQPAAETMPDPFDFYLSSPVVWNGAVFFGSGDGNIYALTSASGVLKWKFKTGDVVHASPAPTAGYSSVVGVVISTRSTPLLGRRSGDSRLAKIAIFTTKLAFSPQRRWLIESCTSVAETPTSMPWMQRRARRNGFCTEKRACGKSVREASIGAQRPLVKKERSAPRPPPKLERL